MCESSITQVTATDVDRGSNGRVSYALHSNSNHDVFETDITTGIVYFHKMISVIVVNLQDKDGIQEPNIILY